jgi:hypothetical protein
MRDRIDSRVPTPTRLARARASSRSVARVVAVCVVARASSRPVVVARRRRSSSDVGRRRMSDPSSAGVEWRRAIDAISARRATDAISARRRGTGPATRYRISARRGAVARMGVRVS